MSSYDVVVIEAGAAGLPAGALPAREGKQVVVLDRSPHFGGQAMAVPDEGFTVNLSGHLVEDHGSGITKAFEQVGKELVHGEISNEMPIRENGRRWGSVRDRHTERNELKKVIRALSDTPQDALDEWHDRPLRLWIHQYTDDQGVVDLVEFISRPECMPGNWYGHSASDTLYVRKMHSEVRDTSAYSC
jgi:phytoene dehydrogenase-like protein